MLILKPFSEDQSRSIVQHKESNLLLSFRGRVCHPNTRTCPRLLGPCFKTGRKEPFGQRPRACYCASSHIGNQQYKYSWKLSTWLQRNGNTPANLHQSKSRNWHLGIPQETTDVQLFSPNTQCTLTLTTRNVNWDHFKTHSYPCGAEASHPLFNPQSYDKELVPFASHLAISRTFNSLSKVLFTFPSRYLFAIGLESIFSFRRKLPPILRTNSKVRDSPETDRTKWTSNDRRDSHPLWCHFPMKLTSEPPLVPHL